MQTTKIKKFLVLFSVPTPTIHEVDYDTERKYMTKQNGNSTSMYPSIVLDKTPNAIFDTIEEAQNHLDTHQESWLEDNKHAIRKYNIEEAISNITLPDGIYNPRNTPFVMWRQSVNELTRGDEIYELERLMADYPDGCFANAYETSTTFFFVKTLKKYHVESLGDGFNYGSTNLLLNCPQNLLILAQND